MMHKAHETIWLQIDSDGESCDPEQWSLEDDATWCKDQINASDVKYIRADIVEAELEVARAEIEQLSKSCLYEAQQWAKWSAEKNLQLAAEQAKSEGLRRFLSSFRDDVLFRIGSGSMYRTLVVEPYYERIKTFLAAPSDTSALEAIVKQAGEVMRLEAKEMILRELFHSTLRINLIDKVCALPAVTLEDLKGGE